MFQITQFLSSFKSGAIGNRIDWTYQVFFSSIKVLQQRMTEKQSSVKIIGKELIAYLTNKNPLHKNQNWQKKKGSALTISEVFNIKDINWTFLYKLLSNITGDFFQ